jgi:hypothetical protein
MPPGFAPLIVTYDQYRGDRSSRGSEERANMNLHAETVKKNYITHADQSCGNQN